MINISVEILRQKKYVIYIALIFSLIIGIAASFQPINSFVFFVLLSIVIGLFVKPFGIPLTLLLLSAITFDYFISFAIAGFDANTLYKLSIIFVMAISFKLHGITFKYSAPMIILSLILILTYTVANFHPRLDPLTPFISFLGISAPFLILLVKWRREFAGLIILCVALLPTISVFAGGVFQIIGIWEVFHQEYLGAMRLQGANIPAHLAMLAFVGLAASIIEIKRRTDKKILFFSLTALNFLIMFSTGTRGAVVASGFIILVFVYDYLKEYIKGRIIVIIPLILFVLTLVIVSITQWNNILMRTFNEHSSNMGINISGRDYAWRFFLSESKGSEIFGQGLGASLTANDGTLYYGFTVPHNEYIRFFFDAGIIGLVLFFSALLYVLVKVGLQIPKSIAVYYFSFIFGFLIYSFVDNTLTTIHFIVPFLFIIAALDSLYTKGVH